MFQEQQLPQPDESLAQYVRRRREELHLSQSEMAQMADIHVQSLGKIEGGKITRLNAKSKNGLSRVLGVSQDYLNAICKGVPLANVQTLKLCPKCWNPGTQADPIWLDKRSKYCFICGTLLRDRCTRCNEPIMSLKFRFCPYCGQPYKDVNNRVS